MRLQKAANPEGYLERGSLVIGSSALMLSPLPCAVLPRLELSGWDNREAPSTQFGEGTCPLGRARVPGTERAGAIAVAVGGAVADLLLTNAAAGLRGSVCVLGPGPRCQGAGGCWLARPLRSMGPSPVAPRGGCVSVRRRERYAARHL